MSTLLNLILSFTRANSDLYDDYLLDEEKKTIKHTNRDYLMCHKAIKQNYNLFTKKNKNLKLM